MANYKLSNALQSMQKIHNQLDNRMSLTPEQIKKRKIEKLRNEMINAKNKVKNSPDELNKAERSYYLESKGSLYYSNIQRDKFKNEAQKQVNSWNRELINNILDNITTSIHYYNSQSNYSKNVNDVYNNYDNKLSSLKKKIYDTEQVKNVNHRLGEFYYNNTEDVTGFTYYLKILYYVLFVISLLIFLFKNQYKKIKMYIFYLTILFMPYLLNKYYAFVMTTFKHFKLDNIYFIFIITIISIINILNFTSTLPFN
jgi:hypothetical protein